MQRFVNFNAYGKQDILVVERLLQGVDHLHAVYFALQRAVVLNH